MDTVGQRDDLAIGEGQNDQLLAALVDEAFAVRRPAWEPVIEPSSATSRNPEPSGLIKRNLRGRQSGGPEIFSDAERNHISGRRPDCVKRAESFPVKERVFPAAIGVHHFDGGVADTRSVVAVLAVEQLLPSGEKDGKWFAQHQLKIRVLAEGRNQVFRDGGVQHALVDRARLSVDQLAWRTAPAIATTRRSGYQIFKPLSSGLRGM